MLQSLLFSLGLLCLAAAPHSATAATAAATAATAAATGSAATGSAATGSAATGSTYRQGLRGCPKVAGEALMASNQNRLLACDAKTLRKYYNENDCCIINLANCNYIQKAWWARVGILKHEALCHYRLKEI
jgi:hypothetical protein